MLLVGPEGRSDRYTHHADGSYTPPQAAYTTLAKNTDGTYTATLADQTTLAFDGSGNLTRITDRFTNQSLLTYSGGRLVSVSDPAARGSLTLAYDTCFAVRLCSVTDWAGRVVHYTYDANGRLYKVQDRQNDADHTTTYGYDSSSAHLTTITDQNNHIQVTNHYDPSGRVDWQKDGLGISTGQQTTISPYGAVAACPFGTSPPCTSTTVTYPQSSFDGKAMTVVDTYDASSRLAQRVSTPSNIAGEESAQTYTYDDANGFRNSVTDGRATTTVACYDVDYRGLAISGSRGNLTRSIAPSPNGGNPLVTLLKYDAKNNVVQTIAPKAVNNGPGVNCATNLSGAINGSGLFVTDLSYDATLGTELLSVTRKYTDPDTSAVQTAITGFEFGDDAANPGRVTRSTSPLGNATTFAYNGAGSQAGLLQSATDPLGNKTTFSYDGVGRMTSTVDAQGNAGQGGDHTSTFLFDYEDRLTSASAPAPQPGDSKLISQHYDEAGNRDSVQDAKGQYTRYAYDLGNNHGWPRLGACADQFGRRPGPDLPHRPIRRANGTS